MLQNPKIRTFVEQLEAEGFILRNLWRGKTEWITTRGKLDIAAFAVVGDGKRPAVGTIIVLDQGDDGFGLWIEPTSGRIEENVRQIVGRLANVGELDREEQGERTERA